MRNYVIIICAIIYSALIGDNICAQSRIDSIRVEVEALNESYNKKLSELYLEMLAISHNQDTSILTRLESMTMFHLFPIDENVNRLLDSIDHKMFSYEGGFEEEYPYWYSFGRIMTSGMSYHLLLMESLDRPLNKDQLFLFALYFDGSSFWFGLNSLSRKEKSTFLRMMANSIVGTSKKKKNLLQIATIIEENLNY